MNNLRPRDFKIWNEEMVKKYDPDQYHHHPNPLVRYIETSRVRSIIGYLGMKEEDSLLEIGCGAGNILEGLYCRRIVGLDMSMYILDSAKKKNITNFQLINATGESLPFKDESFNKIVCSEVLEHVLHPHIIISEARRVLTKEGLLIISIPNEKLINFFKRILIKTRLFGMLFKKKAGSDSYSMSDDMADEWHIHELDYNVVRNMLKDNFVINKCRGIPFNMLPLRYVLQCSKSNISGVTA